MDTTLPSRSRVVLSALTSEPCCVPGIAVAPALDVERTATLAERLKAVADPTRLRMLDLLSQQAGATCVCEITAQFPQRQPTISHHLRILREAGLIAAERRGTWGYYAATEAGKYLVSWVRGLP